MAEALARASASDVLEVRSAGLFPFGRVMDLTKQVLTERGVSCTGLASKSIAETADFHPDLIVNMSGWPVDVKGGTRVEVWAVPDPYGEDIATYERICDDIEARVNELAAKVRKGRASRAAT
jgi:protein-tyrosine-phosphatase